MLHLKQIEETTGADLLALITAGIREGQRIDYKRDINLSTAKAKQELLRDISSFANASGGDIVIGISEESGMPREALGIPSIDFEALEQQILQICRAHLDPAVGGLRTHPIQLSNGNFAFVIRIPKTWNSPHMVMMESENRCWTRDQSGKRPMDVPDLKQAIAYSEGAADRMKKFRMERIGNLIANETPIPLCSNQCFILHLLPLVSFTGNLQVEASKLNNAEMVPMRHGSGWSITFTLEGKITFSSFSGEPAHSYMLLFRNGVIEGVESSGLRPEESGQLKGAKLFYPWHFKMMHDGVAEALTLYRKLGVPSPIFGSISITKVKDFGMFVPMEFRGFARMPMNRDILHFPEFLIDDLDANPMSILKQTFDIWWQACGYSSMPEWVQWS